MTANRRAKAATGIWLAFPVPRLIPAGRPGVLMGLLEQ